MNDPRERTSIRFTQLADGGGRGCEIASALLLRECPQSTGGGAIADAMTVATIVDGPRRISVFARA